MKNNITLVVGTRPNFVKIAPIIHSIKKFQNKGVKLDFRLIHTGQHYDQLMSDDFFKELKIPEPDRNLNCREGTQSEQTAQIIVEFEKELIENRPDIVVVVGDVNSTMACSITAKKLGIKVAHVEAGIRSFDREMPEEINRLIVDSISDYFFTTSVFANENLLKENAKKENIFFVGNTMIDCLKCNINNLTIPNFFKNNLKEKKYFVMTLHRPSNVDDTKKLEKIMTAVDTLTQGTPTVFPVHPRTAKNLEKVGINYKNILIVEPQKYLNFIFLIKNSLGVITDSGGITEEATFLDVPCLTLRNSTERPETIIEGTNELIGDNFELFKKNIDKIIKNKWKKGNIPYLWDGKAADRIIDHIIKILQKEFLCGI